MSNVLHDDRQNALKALPLTLQNTSCRLLLFLRYPQAGFTKTRLIPALGAAEAAELQRQMAEYLLRKLIQPGWQLHIQFTGATLIEMQTWLGKQFAYRLQPTGNLGDRIWAGFQQGFEEGCDRIVAIGADCPNLSPQHIQQAFYQLHTDSVVVGPAQDGGYYLIGLHQPTAQTPPLGQLFQGIDWSTSRVCQQTRLKAQQLGLTLTQLETLSDIDQPKDLVIWERLQTTRNRIR